MTKRRMVSSGSKATFSNRSGLIIQTLKRRIIGWEYPPDHRFTEEALCQEFGVSRSPIREALRVLATNGFVKQMSNRGYAVRQVNLREVEELYDLRLALELHVVTYLAEHDPSNRVVDALRETWSAILREPARKGEELAEFDTRFHEALAEAAGNAMLLNHLRGINERIFVFRMVDFEKRDRLESTCNQHLKILERIADGDSVGARQAMQGNIEEGGNNVRSAVKEALAKAYALS
jgi:DNA-binding GntR family transcriptional regulator